MKENATAQKILDTALTMFSQRGYSDVSVRDICGAIGIKESSMYYHFMNKRAIYDALEKRFVSSANSYVERLTARLGGESAEPHIGAFVPDNSFFERISDIFLNDWLLDEFNIKFIKTLGIERLHSKEAAELYNKFVFDMPIAFQSDVFSRLVGMGVIPPTDVEYLAVRYYSPVLFYYERYMLSVNSSESNRARFIDLAKKHFTAFINE